MAPRKPKAVTEQVNLIGEAAKPVFDEAHTQPGMAQLRVVIRSIVNRWRHAHDPGELTRLQRWMAPLAYLNRNPELFYPQTKKGEPVGQAPIPMRLPCPSCGQLHIDEGLFARQAHHTHACQHCGNVWRPAIVPTVGVM